MGRKLTLVISFWGSAFSIRDARGRHLGDRVRPKTVSETILNTNRH